MLVSQLFTGIEHTTKQSDVFISSITNDTRQIEKDSLFICIKGLKFDGHSLAQQALDLGASAIVCEKDLGLENQIIVSNTREAYAILCANFFGNPSKYLKLIGVTGTNGKTTITYLLKHILETAGKKVGLIGTIQNEIGDMVLPAKHTTPDPFQLHAIFAQMKEAGCEYVVMEVSSHAMDQHRLDACKFCAGIFINLTQDHLDYHGTMEAYYLAKKKLFSICEIGVLNIDDSYGQKLKETLKIPVVTFSTKKDQATYTAKNIEFNIKGSKFAFVGNEKIARIQIPMPGEFSVSNAMAAITCCLSIGIELDIITHSLQTCNGITGRCEI
ncbi:MAG: UDP-N-acetylmuramoyl-L-alanyl-D-glutamate--2,6-diaminopimelate ligase, partial [Oscillospiraceae bacterium]